MTYKTILVHCDGSDATARRLAIAVSLAGRFGAHLVGLHVKPPFEMAGYMESGLAMEHLLAEHARAVEADAASAVAAFDKATKGAAAACEWRQASGQVEDELIVQTRYADLLVAGQADPSGGKGLPAPAGLVESVALATGRPLLVVPYAGAFETVGKTVLVCWNASRPASRAVSDALPILQAADNVVVLSVDARRSALGHGAEPGSDAATWLARHGVKVTVQRDVAPDTDVGSIILSRAADHGADLIVMGLYGHSRVRELVLGGVSRTLLASMTVPVITTH